MPYLNKAKRNELQFVVQDLVTDFASRAKLNGELNYILFTLAKKYIKSYADLQTFVGEIECAKLEIYRRIGAPYEDTKIQENGDV